MEFTATTVPGVFVAVPRVFGDSRGFFFESYTRRAFAEHGIDTEFVQDNHSRSKGRGVLRGLHFQLPPHEQAKLVRCTRGAIYDVIVDVRRGSPAFGRWEGFELTEENRCMLFVPRGCAHGFCTLTEDTEVLYKADNYYAPDHDSGLVWNDPALDISWPVDSPVLSAKDQALPRLAEFSSPFRYV